MSETKETVIEAIRELPQDASIEDINYRIYILTRLDKARREADAGDLIPHEVVEEKMKKWIIE